MTTMSNSAEFSATPSRDPLAPGPLLLVDDSYAFRERLARAFRERGFDVATASDYDEAMAEARANVPRYAVLDLRMPGRSGLELLRDLKELTSDIDVLMLTGFGSIATAIDAVRLGALNYLPKPADAEDILNAFRQGVPDPQVEMDEEQVEAPSLARTEWEHIHRVLSDCDGNISEAARRLGIHRRSLQRKLRKRAPE